LALLSVRDLRVSFPAGAASVAAVDGLSFRIDPGEVFALVGESGCGKSLTALSILGLQPPAARRSAEILAFKDRDLTTLPDEELRAVRGREIAMIFQEPMTSLNPVFTVGDQIGEMLETHLGLSPRETRIRTVELLRQVNIPEPEERLRSYPHQLSGGLRQRVMIAMALACNPSLLIADEPTTALDVTIQAQILHLLTELRNGRDLGLLFITHDLGVVAQVADRVMVMYAGVAMEETRVDRLFAEPRHPYTRGLLRSLPRDRRHRLDPIRGSVPPPGHLPAGCRFGPRCPHVEDVCRDGEPVWREMADTPAGVSHRVRCVRAEEL